MSDQCVICHKAMQHTIEDGFLIDVCEACINELLSPRPTPPAKCTICHVNPVYPEDGQDTCAECLARQ